MNNCEWLMNMTYEQRGEWLEAEHADGDMDNDVSVQKRPDDSREKLEADVRDWAITTNAVFPENRVKSVKGFLDRQAAITHSVDAWNIKRLEEERESLQDQVDKLLEALDQQRAATANANDLWGRTRDELAAVKAELAAVRAERDNLADDLLSATRERETYRSKFGESLDLADEIRALGADCDTGVAR